MFRRISSCCISILLLGALLHPASAQNQIKKKKISYGDTIANKFIPTGVRVGVDAIGFLKDGLTKNWRGWEVNADVDFWRYYLVTEIGYWSRHDSINRKGTYDNDGRYVRIGADMNFMLKEREKNMFFMGFRYGHSTFNESVYYAPPEDSLNYRTVTHTGLTAHWVELVSGLRIRIWGPIWMGYVARLKFGASVKGAGVLKPYDIPGYGLAEKGSTWGINYQIMFRFPIRKIR